MNKFKALLTKDFRISRKTLQLPIFITAGFYLVSIILGILALIHHGVDLKLSDLQMLPQDFLNYVVNLGIVSFPSLLCIIFTIMLAQGALNEDIRNNSELFHRSQPVSMWKRTFSKFAVSIGGNWLIMLIIVLFNFLVVNIILGIYGKFIFYPAVSGVLQGMISTIRATLVVGSLTYLASAIFPDKAFLKMLAFILGIQILLGMINILFGMHLPLPLSYLWDLIAGGMNSINLADGHFAEIGINKIVNDRWNEILFNWRFLVQILFSGIFYVAGTFIYQNKEVK